MRLLRSGRHERYRTVREFLRGGTDKCQRLCTVKTGGRRRAGYPLLVLCAVLLFGFSLVNIVWPKRTQLELENRKAAQLPAFSVSALLDGSWQSGFAPLDAGSVFPA